MPCRRRPSRDAGLPSPGASFRTAALLLQQRDFPAPLDQSTTMTESCSHSSSPWVEFSPVSHSRPPSLPPAPTSEFSGSSVDGAPKVDALVFTVGPARCH